MADTGNNSLCMKSFVLGAASCGALVYLLNASKKQKKEKSQATKSNIEDDFIGAKTRCQEPCRPLSCILEINSVYSKH
eukprot:m.347328 g.347328  ORF g.347328 m.347328 type:complete len:78 (-) comp32387_c0_seq1:1036-1269(-)